MEPREEEIMVVEDTDEDSEEELVFEEDATKDEKEEPQEQEVIPLAPAPAPSPEPLQEEAEPVSPPPMAVASEPPQHVGWIEEHYSKDPNENAFYHTLLVEMLEHYCADLQATVEYHNVEHKHPLMNSYWKWSYLSNHGMWTRMLARWSRCTPTL
jgi:hypothetical protein